MKNIEFKTILSVEVLDTLEPFTNQKEQDVVKGTSNFNERFS